MGKNRYYYLILIRLTGVLLNCICIAWFLTQPERPATTLFFIMLLIVLVFDLFRFLNMINHKLSTFLSFLEDEDVSMTGSKEFVKYYFSGFTESLEKVRKTIHASRLRTAEKHYYLKMILEHLDFAVFSYQEGGMIQYYNQSVLSVFGIRKFITIQDLTNLYPGLKPFLDGGEISQGNIFQFQVQDQIRQLKIRAEKCRIGDEMIYLVSCQDIHSELTQQELDAWKKLMRVLRHEILNSMTPITTITTAIKRIFISLRNTSLQERQVEEKLEDALSGLEVIEDRSKGLISFVDQFKTISSLPVPDLKDHPVSSLFDKALWLFRNENISLKFDIQPENLWVRVDEYLIGQVLINLVKNAREASGKHPVIELSACSLSGDFVKLEVKDQGSGMDGGELELIFLPSYTTKPDGLGIGLSISKQIIQLHGGTIMVSSEIGRGSTFTLLIPK